MENKNSLTPPNLIEVPKDSFFGQLKAGKDAAVDNAVKLLNAKTNFTMAYEAGSSIVDDLNATIHRLEKLRELNPYQQKDLQDARKISGIFKSLTQSCAEIEKYSSQSEKEAFLLVAESASTEIDMLQVSRNLINQLQAEKKQLIEENERIKSELNTAVEMLNDLADKFINQ